MTGRRSPTSCAGFRLVCGSRFWVWMKSPNLSGSRTKKTGVLLPTRSHFFLGIELQRKSPRIARAIG